MGVSTLFNHNTSTTNNYLAFIPSLSSTFEVVQHGRHFSFSENDKTEIEAMLNSSSPIISCERSSSPDRYSFSTHNVSTLESMFISILMHSRINLV